MSNPSNSFSKNLKLTIRHHPFLFAGLFLLIFITIILCLTALFINRPVSQTPEQLTDSEQAYEEAKNYTASHPIIEKLPIIYANYDAQYNYTEYRIDGGRFGGCDTDFCLKITDTTGGNYEAAIQKIRDAGFNPSDFQIFYQYQPIQPLN